LASEIIDRLLASDDNVDREVAEALIEFQENKARQGLSRHLGYEPRDIKEKGAVAVIEARVMKSSSGFEDVDDQSSYEAIVDRNPERFRDEVVAIARSRLKQSSQPLISSEDVRLIASSRAKQKYAELSEAEKAAYVKISTALEMLGNRVRARLSNSEKFKTTLTSGFNVKSGVRGFIPKDLWFSVSPRQNSDLLAGMPQIFMIVSERGLEYGYGASVSPSDFSTQSVKELVRGAAPEIFSRLPKANSSEAETIQDEISESGGWYYRRKHRLLPAQNDFENFSAWLSYLQSEAGVNSAAGTVSRYIAAEEIDAVDLKDQASEMARIFEPLLDRDWQSSGGSAEPPLQHEPEDNMMDGGAEFAEKLSNFLNLFEEKRTAPFTIDTELGAAIRDVQSWLEGLPAVSARSTTKLKMSVGQGGWTKTPWIALLDERETTSTQRGTYIVFLIAEDLSMIYLTLNQGMTKLRDSLGQRGAVEHMVQVAEVARPKIRNLARSGFTLDNAIDLRSDTGAAKNYEIGTIAHADFQRDIIPDDAIINRLLSDLLEAYDTLIDPSSVEENELLKDEAPAMAFEPYSIDDALEELFLERDDVERYLDIWENKKNLILQGAPGVGKSFIARRLAYALIGYRDDRKVQTVQFHQSYSYEDFVQGYRPNGSQGFERKNGSFYGFCDRAIKDPDGTYVFIIDEINRGNLSKIFGELMLLVEPDKRGAKWATRLAYATDQEPSFYVPPNVYILGMMNTADRSLSLVDYALRRRFAFVSMEPLYGAAKFRAHLESRGVSEDVINKVTNGMGELNQEIESDRVNLGPGFRIGHSFFTPTKPIGDAELWFRRVVETEIYPLLEEYWFDVPENADQWRDRLLG
tara:strand:- start:15134 stop:17719 length:2586 start_codon:yes stop_codon:yes gene_type:complete